MENPIYGVVSGKWAGVKEKIGVISEILTPMSWRGGTCCGGNHDAEQHSS